MHSVPLLSRDFVRHYLITMRPYLMFVSGITGLSGLALAPAMPWFKTLLLFSVFFLSYGFGQALTDCFQIDTDTLSSPYRPLTQGLIAKNDVLVVSLSGLIVSGLILTWAAPVNFPLALAAVFGLATYTYFKKRWWAGPFYNAWIVLLLALMAAAAGFGYWPGSFLYSRNVLLVGTMVFFGYADFVLIGYFKDVSADGQTGYRTLPVTFGLKISATVSDGFAFVTAAAWFLFIVLNDKNLSLWTYLFGPAGFAALVYTHLMAHKVRSENEAHKAVVPVVHAYILLLSSVISTLKPAWGLPLILFYAAFVLTMKFRPERRQI